MNTVSKRNTTLSGFFTYLILGVTPRAVRRPHRLPLKVLRAPERNRIRGPISASVGVVTRPALE